MNKLFFFLFIFYISCSSIDEQYNSDPRFTSGREFKTNKVVPPKVLHFDLYSVVVGNDSTASTLGLYYNNKEILFSRLSDGMFDTIINTNLNNDGIKDFLVICKYEDGSSLLSLLSKSKFSFVEKELSKEISEYYCGEIYDTANYIQPIVISDINNDGKNEVVINSVKMNGILFGIACTDTIYMD